MIMLGWGVTLAHFILLPLVELLPVTIRPGWLVATFALGFAGTTAYHVNAQPYLMDVTSEEERDHAFSVYLALFTLGGFVGSIAGGLLPALFAGPLRVSLDHPAPYRYAFLANALIVVPGIPVLLAIRDVAADIASQGESRSGPLPLSVIATLTASSLLLYTGYGVLWTFFNVYLDAGLGASSGLIGALMAVGNLLPGVATLAAPLAMARWGKKPTVLMGYVGMAASLLPLALVPHWVAAGVGYVGYLSLMALMQPALTVFGQEIVAPGWRPTMSGALMLAQGAGSALLAIVGGYAITALGFQSPYWIAAGLTGVGALVFWLAFQRGRVGDTAPATSSPIESAELPRAGAMDGSHAPPTSP
jgi:predicted MFS family arabinose efflux permease